MKTDDLDYSLPEELIAQQPAEPRDSGRLLTYDRASGAAGHRRLRDLPRLLKAGDLLVYNDSRVLPARLFARRPGGGRVELLFLHRVSGDVWEALARPSARLKEGMEIVLDGDMDEASPGTRFIMMERLAGGRWLVENLSGQDTEAILDQHGQMPLPTYIRQGLREPGRYQTVYAASPGSAAAPTAGLHFTDALIDRLRQRGVTMAPLTLHVGLDTFRPVSADDLSGHAIHRERYFMPESTCEAVVAARGEGRRVVAVGTTSVRVLETVFQEPRKALAGETSLFITPGCRFRAVDCLLTNFHLPRSTLLALVMAFAGIGETRRLYQAAIAERYRFYSFGDAMLVE